jgi:drug/metabolite transporter (DMT)-like permease
LLSALFSGIAYVSVIKLRSTEHPLNIVIYFPMLSIPIMLIWCMFDFVLPEGIDWIYLLLLGIFTQIAQLLLTKALMYGNVEVVSPFQYLGSIYAILLGYYIFDEKLSYIAIAGIALIIVGVISNVLLQKKANKKIP